MPKDYFQFTDSNSMPRVSSDGDTEISVMTRLDQEKVLDFIHQVLRKECDPGDQYIDFIQDGTVIEELLLRCCATPLGKKKKLPSSPSTKDRAEKIANDMFEFGISVEHLFEPDDLIKAKNIPKVTAALLQLSEMVYTGQGRSRLKSVPDVTRSAYKCSLCQDKFKKSDALRAHLFQEHPDKVGPNLKRILQKYSDIA